MQKLNYSRMITIPQKDKINFFNFFSLYSLGARHGLVATIVVRQIFNEDKNLSQQIHEDKRQKDKC